MRLVKWRVVVVALVFSAIGLLALLVASAPKFPIAVIRVTDAAGKPIEGAVVQGRGLRTKPGPYTGGWYGWMTGQQAVRSMPVTTDRHGIAHLPYPKYVFERIETGTLCLSVNHPDYVPEDPERIVATALPAGAPWRERLKEIWDRARHKVFVTEPDPIVLRKGATLKISVAEDALKAKGAKLFAEVSGTGSDVTNFWLRPSSNAVLTHRLSPGKHTLRAVVLAQNGSASFSEVVEIDASISKASEFDFALKPGVMVQGKLDDRVPRPVRNGRVIAHIWPRDFKPEEGPPTWHAWAQVKEDGTFSISSLPSGDLEILAMCDGFVSTNGPGKYKMRYPQKHLLQANDLTITIGMEQTARLEVTVTDEKGKPLKDVRVSTWPNARYGEWGAVVLMGDCYNQSDYLLKGPVSLLPWKMSPDLEGVSDSNGLAVLPNLPTDTTELSAGNSKYGLPISEDPGGGKTRHANFALVAGQTNRISIQLEPLADRPISHY